jgi:nitroreductase
MECGHAGQNISLQAAALGLGTVAVGAFEDDAVQRVLDVPHPVVYLFPVGFPK